MGIDNDYEVFCFDEVVMVLFNKAMDDRSNIKWDRIKWKGEKRDNKQLIEFIKIRIVYDLGKRGLTSA